jgi:hypothetical protein
VPSHRGIRAGFPPPRTQIPLYDRFGQLIALLDMGWEDVEALNDLGWLVVRVTAEDTPGGVIHRVAAARARRT